MEKKMAENKTLSFDDLKKQLADHSTARTPKSILLMVLQLEYMMNQALRQYRCLLFQTEQSLMSIS